MRRVYPLADAGTQWFAGRFTATFWDALEKLVLHTTETPGWPDYDGGAIAPNATGRPVFGTGSGTGRISWRAHFDACESARALRNEPGGVLTNTDRAHQIELVGTCDPATSERWQRSGLLPDQHFVEWWRPPQWALSGLAAYCLWLHDHCGLQLAIARPWVAFPASFGTRAVQRLQGAAWDQFRGICGHEHAAENSHGDPGAFPGQLLLDTVHKLRPPAGPTPIPEEDDMAKPRLVTVTGDPKKQQWLVYPSGLVASMEDPGTRDATCDFWGIPRTPEEEPMDHRAFAQLQRVQPD